MRIGQGHMYAVVSLLGFACFVTTTLGAERPADISPFIGQVDEANVVGGYASTHIIVQVQPGVSATVLNDGRWSFQSADAAQPGQVHAGTGPQNAEPLDNALADALDNWEIVNITSTLPFSPANPELAAQHGLDRYYTIHVPEGTDTNQMVQQLVAFPEHFDNVERDGIGGILQSVPNDPSLNEQYGLHNTGQVIQGQAGIAGADINALAAWEIHTGTDDITIAIVDTGILTGHPDLSDKLVTGYNSIDGSSNVEDSWLFAHGTHVAGIAAASTNNGIGIAGVSWGARIMPIKTLDDLGGGTESNIANGIIWAADNGAQVINMSLGVPDGISFFENACQYVHDLGVLVIAASGNTPGAAIPPPAKWETVMAVGATDNRDELADFTTTGPEMSVTAPGEDVYSTWDSWFGGPTYSFQSGTSMAAPHVAGLAALIWSANLDLTNEEVWSIIEDTADDKGTPGWNQQFGHGRINAYEALLAALDAEPCAFADINCDGVVDVFDLLIIIGDWGLCDDPDDCPADLTGPDGEPDGVVDVFDLLELIGQWG